MDRHVAPLRTHYPDTEPTWPLLLNLKCCALRGEVVNTNFIVFDLTQLFYDYSNTSLFDEQVLLTTTPVLAIVINSKTQKEDNSILMLFRTSHSLFILAYKPFGLVVSEMIVKVSARKIILISAN